jgi:hypothetical protein
MPFCGTGEEIKHTSKSLSKRALFMLISAYFSGVFQGVNGA